MEREDLEKILEGFTWIKVMKSQLGVMIGMKNQD
jgi:hypothetical protein